MALDSRTKNLERALSSRRPRGREQERESLRPFGQPSNGTGYHPVPELHTRTIMLKELQRNVSMGAACGVWLHKMNGKIDPYTIAD